MTKKLLTTIISGLVITLVSSISFAQMHGRSFKHRADHIDKIDNLIQVLDLSENQIKNLKELKSKIKNQKSPVHAQIKKLHEQMKIEWQKKNPDKKTILKLHSKIHKAKGELAKHRITMRFAINKILTYEQRVKARKLIKNREQRPEGRFKKGHNKRRRNCEQRRKRP